MSESGTPALMHHHVGYLALDNVQIGIQVEYVHRRHPDGGASVIRHHVLHVHHVQMIVGRVDNIE